MNSPFYLKALTDPSLAPCFVLVDMQKEYVESKRLLGMPEAGASLKKCRQALHHARSMGFPVACLRQISRSPFFNPATEFCEWIEGFEPVRSDMVFDRDKPSCYSSKRFSELMDSCGGHFVIAGFAGETACLSTAIDAYHRNHSFTYLADASASHSLKDFSATTVQKTVTEIIRVYGKVLDTDAWISNTSDIAIVSRGSADE